MVIPLITVQVATVQSTALWPFNVFAEFTITHPKLMLEQNCCCCHGYRERWFWHDPPPPVPCWDLVNLTSRFLIASASTEQDSIGLCPSQDVSAFMQQVCLTVREPGFVHDSLHRFEGLCPVILGCLRNQRHVVARATT
jgi:hypothetical protein